MKIHTQLLGVIVLVLIAKNLAPAQTEQTITAPNGDPRPIATMIAQLRKGRGLPITYEDPRYLFAGDLQDVTEQVRRANDTETLSRTERIIVPKGKAFTFVYSSNDMSTAAGSLETIRRMLSEYARIGGPVFAATDDGKRLHVIPQQAADEAGRLVPQTPVLDTSISITPRARNGLALLSEICAAVSVSSRVQVEVGTVPGNLLAQYSSAKGFDNKPARQVLGELLDGLHSSHTLVWDLYNDLDGYALNIK
jgi:hypothetical protein